jgi:LysR family transcriptional regulator, positive regulator for ilvC
MPELEDLRLTIAAADLSNFGAVARNLHVSQSTVSRAVQRVEASVGRPLFAREGRTVRLLPEAGLMIDPIRQLVEDWDRLVSTARTAERKELTVFCTVTASQLIAPPLFERFRRARPDVHVDLRTGSASSALPAVLEGSVDVAIAPLPDSLPRGLVAVARERTPFVAVAVRDIRTLTDQTLLLSRQGLLRELSERWVRRNLGSDVPVREAETNEEVLALAAMGSGVAIIPKLVVSASPLKGRVHEVPVPAELPMITVGLVAKKRSIDADPLADLWALA